MVTETELSCHDEKKLNSKFCVIRGNQKGKMRKAEHMEYIVTVVIENIGVKLENQCKTRYIEYLTHIRYEKSEKSSATNYVLEKQYSIEENCLK